MVLLPKVHESFRIQDVHLDTHSNDAQQDQEPLQEPHNHHRHHHSLPLGEVIICVGFFVFYSLGLCVSSRQYREDGQSIQPGQKAPVSSLTGASRKVSTVCCSSTPCPTSRLVKSQESTKCRSSETNVVANESVRLIDGEPLDGDDYDPDANCVMLLNRHHIHHTHSRHHSHSAPIVQQQHQNVASRKRAGYGSTLVHNVTPDLVRQSSGCGETTRPNNSNTTTKSGPIIYVDEISITRFANDYEDLDNLQWPLSMKVTIFALVLAVCLILFDLNINGVQECVKVFRAAATGALLYIAFFLVLPRHQAGCNSCSEEEI